MHRLRSKPGRVRWPVSSFRRPPPGDERRDSQRHCPWRGGRAVFRPRGALRPRCADTVASRGCGERDGIGRGVLRFEFFDRFDIAGVGYDHRHFLKLFKQCLGHAISLLAYTFSVRLLALEILKIAIGFMGPQNCPSCVGLPMAYRLGNVSSTSGERLLSLPLSSTADAE